MQELITKLCDRYPAVDRYGVYHVVNGIKEENPQLNDKTKIVEITRPYVYVSAKPDDMCFPMDASNTILERKKGIIPKLRRLWGEIISQDPMKNEGWNKAPRPIKEHKIEIRGLYHRDGGIETRLYYAYYAPGDTLFIYKLYTNLKVFLVEEPQTT